MVEVVGVEVEALAFAGASRHLIAVAVVASASPCPPADVSTQPCHLHTSVLTF